MSAPVGEPHVQPPVQGRWTLRNCTPWPIWVERDGRVLSLAPLEEREEREDPRAAFGLGRLVDRRQVEVVEAGSGPVLDRRARRTRRAVRRLARRAHQWVTMAVVVAVALVLPAAAIHFGTDLHRQIAVDASGLRVQEPLELIGRLLQLTMITVASLLPALMYFQFDASGSRPCAPAGWATPSGSTPRSARWPTWRRSTGRRSRRPTAGGARAAGGCRGGGAARSSSPR